jgi:hypothetical protein
MQQTCKGNNEDSFLNYDTEPVMAYEARPNAPLTSACASSNPV